MSGPFRAVNGALGSVNNAVGRANAVVGVVSGTIGQVGAIVNNVGNLANNVAGLLGGGPVFGAPLFGGGYAGIIASGLGPWADGLQTASWRGLPFAVRSSQIRRGRRVSVHEYPFRDEVWVEDLGRGRRTVSFNAFLVGDDVYAQRDAMSSACDVAGPGQLVHPSLGTLTATNIEFSAGERADLGRVVEIEFSFIQSGQDQPIYPTAIVSTQADTLAAASGCLLAASSDFVGDVIGAVALGVAVVQGAIGTVLGFVSSVVGTVQAVAMLGEQIIAIPAEIAGAVLNGVGQIVGLVNDSAISIGCVLGLPGYNGRYSSSGLVALLPVTATVATQLAAMTANKAAVQIAMASALQIALDNPLSLPAAVQSAISALQSTLASPSDQIRLLATLAAFQTTTLPTAAAIGSAIATFQLALASLIRRTACAALATATAAYQPTSSNDAMAQINAVATLLDAEALVAADVGDTDSYLALEALRAAVVQDLLLRGAQLPSLVTVTRGAPLPSLTLAYALYGDSTRSDDLIARADPINPLFMPTVFQALSS